MTSIADQLPPEIARQIHPERRKNEADYWIARDQLLEQHRGLWIGFANGIVIASGNSPVAVFHEAESSGQHPFVICVGKEDVPSRIRRARFSYDVSYPIEALPLVSVEFRQVSSGPAVVLDRVIPDTGADASVLPWVDCQRLQLTPSMGMQSLMGGVSGSSTATLAFRILANLDGQDYPCRLQVDFLGNERILGRDVLNRLEIVFRGPTGEVVVNP